MRSFYRKDISLIGYFIDINFIDTGHFISHLINRTRHGKDNLGKVHFNDGTFHREYIL